MAGVLLAQGTASAATVGISIVNSSFNPSPAVLIIGDSAKWTNGDAVNHTSTGNSPLSLWDSGTIAPGGSFTYIFRAAASYGYRCTIHSGMFGTVNVTPQRAPASGPVGTLFYVKVATNNAPGTYVYDVQIKRPGSSSYTTWMYGTTARIVTFDSTGQPAGSYKFRSRLRNTAVAYSATNYSPAVGIVVG